MTFFDWLAQLPAWGSILLISSALLTVIFFVVSILSRLEDASVSADGKARTFRLGFKGLPEDKKKGPASSKTRPSSHGSCPNVAQVLVLFHDYDRFWSWEHELEYVRILADQMNEAEAYLQSAVDLLRKNFLALATSTRGADTNFMELREYAMFNTLLDLCKNKVRSFFRRCFKENHLAAKSEPQFSDYKRGHITQIVDTIDAFFLEHYPTEGQSPSREELHEMLKRSYPEFENYCGQAFDRARFISKHYNDQLRDKEAAIDAEYEAIFGTKPGKKYD